MTGYSVISRHRLFLLLSQSSFLWASPVFVLPSLPMADEKRDKDNVATAEFKVSMHCNACERSVAKVISKIKGVEKFITDMNRHKVVVIGHMDPFKVLKKLKKKTGRRVEMIVAINEEGEKDAGRDAVDGDSVEPAPAPEMIQEYAGQSLVRQYSGDSAVYTMFSDENANACSIM